MYLPKSVIHEKWRSVILQGLDLTTQYRVKQDGNYRIAAHHFHPDCIGEGDTKFLQKFISNKKDIFGRKFNTRSRNYVVNKSEYPQGSKSCQLWFSIPDKTNQEAERNYYILDADYKVKVDIAMAEEEREKKQREMEEQKRTSLIEAKLRIKMSIANDNVREEVDKYDKATLKEIQGLKDDIERLTQKSIQDDLMIHTLKQEHSELLQRFDGLQESTVKSIIKSGGISAYNLTNSDFHKENPTACHILFGFRDYSEMKVRLACMFKEFRNSDTQEEVFPDRTVKPLSRRRNENSRNYENCLITLMRFHLKPTLDYLVLVWKLSKPVISKAIEEWAPKLGQKGLELSILDIKSEFFENLKKEVLRAILTLHYRQMKDMMLKIFSYVIYNLIIIYTLIKIKTIYYISLFGLLCIKSLIVVKDAPTSSTCTSQSALGCFSTSFVAFLGLPLLALDFISSLSSESSGNRYGNIPYNYQEVEEAD